METPLFVLIFFILFCSCIARDTITLTQPLVDDGEILISANGTFALGFFSPPNTKNRYIGIWFNKITVQTVVWVASRNIPVRGSTGALLITGSGALAIVDKNSTDIVWSSAGTSNVTNPVAQLLDTGNFVVRDEQRSAGEDSHAWQSFDYPTDTLIAGMKMGVDLNTGLNRTFVSWKSESDPAPGNYSVSMDLHGAPEFFVWQGTTKVFRSGPWNGVRWSGIPDITTYDGFNFSFVDNKNEVTYSFFTTSSTSPIISRVVVNQTGFVQRWVWVEASGVWDTYWYVPRDQCDYLSRDGPYAVCDTDATPMCNCLPGFAPKVPLEWALRKVTSGCVRRTPLDCWNGTDGFWTVTGAKLPDSSKATVDLSVTAEECRAMCLSNCSCMAYAAADIRNGESGCIIWTSELTDIRVYTTGQNLYVRLAAADLERVQSQKKSNAAVAIIVSTTTTSASLVIACIGFAIWRRRKTSRKVGSGEDCRSENSLELPVYDLSTITVATDNFSSLNKLGQGGFGPVYKGKLGDGQEIAVKSLSATSIQGLDEFKNEVTLIAKLQHRNLVRLLGCCIEDDERMLIYEYLDNKSLDMFLFDKGRSALLDWQTRYKIISGIARGLLYLHQDSRLRVIHRDLKASNILLDKEMNPKISDFGMARLFQSDETEGNTNRVVGTYGYISPEYLMDGVFSLKSDVFSFGVLVLEIISGKKNRELHVSNLNLLAHVWSVWSEGTSLQIVDESMGDSFSPDEVLRCIKVGLLCVQDRPEDRPLMSSVVPILGGDNISLADPKHPGLIMR